MITPLGISETYFKLLYNVGYALMAIIALVWAYRMDRGNEDKLPSFISKYALPFFMLYFIVIVGFRDVSVGTDKMNYHYCMAGDVPPIVKIEVIFSWIMKGLSSIGAHFTVFLCVIATLFYGLIAYALKNLSNKYQTNVFFIIFSFISLFFVESLAINIIRQALSLAFLIFAYSLWERKQYTAYQNENKTI